MGISPESGHSGGLMTLDALTASPVISHFASSLRNHRGFRPFSVAEGSFFHGLASPSRLSAKSEVLLDVAPDTLP
jgi:hypothetical protein